MRTFALLSLLAVPALCAPTEAAAKKGPFKGRGHMVLYNSKHSQQHEAAGCLTTEGIWVKHCDKSNVWELDGHSNGENRGGSVKLETCRVSPFECNGPMITHPMVLDYDWTGSWVGYILVSPEGTEAWYSAGPSTKSNEKSGFLYTKKSKHAKHTVTIGWQECTRQTC